MAPLSCRRRRLTLFCVGAAFALASAGCGGAGKGTASSSTPSAGKPSTCSTITTHLASFGEVLETASSDAKTRVATYAGLLELLLSFDSAATELNGELGSLSSGAMSGELSAKVKTARGSLDRSSQFARTELASIEKHAHEIAPLAKETQQAWTALRATCEGKKGPPDCNGVRDVIAKFDAAESNADHDRAVAELNGLRIPTPAIAKSRDRAVAASKAVQVAIKSRSDSTQPLPKRWGEVQKDLGNAMDGLVEACKGESPMATQLVSASKPDPRKLTVLVHVKPPAGVERALLTLAKSSKDEDEREFYKARAEGAFGSGFVLVKKGDKGGTEVLVVTNRHVVELGDKAALELADGTQLGNAEIVYSSPTHDLAVLRPAASGKLASVSEGFAFASSPAKDQQTVIATGFPGLVGRPSYQTTKGYVSNESFKLDEGGSSRALTYVQHTAPIDPGSSGGPLTDEAGRVLGVNTLKVTGREAVGLAVPSKYVVDTLRFATNIETHHASAPNRQKEARLACLGFLGELGATEPRMLVLEQMISNHLTGVEGLEAAAALAGEEGFEHLWNTDSVRAMRIASLVKLRAHFMMGGGPSVLETCDDPDTASVKPDHVKYRVRLANFEMRDLHVRYEQGRWKIDGLEGKASAATTPSVKAPAKKLPAPGPPTTNPPKKGVTPPGSKK